MAALAMLSIALLLISLGAFVRPASAQGASASASASPSPSTGADLRISGSASPDPAEVGRELTYDLFAENVGSSTAANVVVEDTLPANVEFVSATAGGFSPCAQTAGVVTCNLGDLAAFDSVDVQVVVLPTAEGIIENVATISGDIQDPTPENNTSRISTQVKPPRRL